MAEVSPPDSSPTTAAQDSGDLRGTSVWRDYLSLTKPRITLMVLVTTTMGYLAAGGDLEIAALAFVLAGVGLLSSGATTLNHFWERETDALMHRTANRPLPAGRLAPDRALAYGVVLSLAGMSILSLAVNLMTAMLGALALTSYVFVYTPLKRVTSLATLVGAVPGALPPVMGWTGAGSDLSAGAWALFGILFLWQLPHTLAIAWLYREDYARAGFPMLPVMDPDGRATARQAVLYGLALLPVSLLPTVVGLSGGPYFVGALALGLAFLGSCIAFAIAATRTTARRLMVVSLLYLPAILVAMFLDRLI